jgi:MFS transporter, DHA1 family, inner membrane transport protein
MPPYAPAAMLTPARLSYAFRPRASVAILAAAAAVAALFAATPFVLTEIASRFEVSLGTAGVMSTLQVGAFAAATFLSGRVLRPGRAVLVSAAIALVAANVLSAVAAWFPLFLTSRAVAGAGAGVLTWLAWSDAMRHPRAMRDVAVVGPIIAMVASPLLAWLASSRGDRAVFVALAIAAVPAALLPARFPDAVAPARAVSPSRSNRVILGALLLLTLSGSSLFIYAAAAGTDLAGMDPVAVSLAFSVNAAAGIVGTRLRPRAGTGGLWLLGTAVAAATLVFVPNPAVFFAAMALWGVSFWLGIPDTMQALSARSLTPAERAGDAQSLMAIGRAAGPLVGGLLVGEGRYGALAAFAAIGLAVAALTIAGVAQYRRRRPAPAYAPEA